MPFWHVCDPVGFHIAFFKDEFAMISSGTRLVRNTVWHLPIAFSHQMASQTEKILAAETTAKSFYRQSEQDLRAELSARLAKLCNYSGKSSRR
jgi:hypothetical protein